MEKKIAICMPTYRAVYPEVFASLSRFIFSSVMNQLVVGLNISVNMYVTKARNKLVEESLDAYHKGICTHVLFIDDDMLIPDGSLERLVAHDKPIVSGLYYSTDLNPVAYQGPQFLKYEDVRTGGLIQVDGVGMGFCLIDCKVFDDMSKQFQDNFWFKISVNHEGGDYQEIGEDINFFRRVKELEIPVYLDCGVQLGHSVVRTVEHGHFKIR